MAVQHRGKSVRVTINLPTAHARVVKELADSMYDGNVSRTFVHLVESHPVTKSHPAFALKATAGQLT